MTAPLSGPRPDETEWLEQHKRYEWTDEPVRTYLEVRVYYKTQTGQVTRATIENTSTKHIGLLVVAGKQGQELFRTQISAPHVLQEFDLSTYRVTVRGSDNSDRFSLNLAARG